MRLEEKSRILESEKRFRDLVKVLERGGFKRNDCFDLRQCMERGWSFGRLTRALEQNGKKLELSDEELSTARKAYVEAMETLIFYHRHLMRDCDEIGFDQVWVTKVVGYCISRDYSYHEFAESLAEQGWPLAFSTIAQEMKAEACYEAMLSQGRQQARSKRGW